MSGSNETVHLVQRQDYQFEMQFGGAAPNWLADEPPPLRQGAIAVRIALYRDNRVWARAFRSPCR